MARMVRICFQSMLKLANSGIGMIGIALILYGIWLIRVWQREMGQSPFGGSDSAPWFIYTSLGVGFTLCLITCWGHIAAETVNGCFLYLYMVLVFLLLMLEAGVSADVFLNADWEKDFPEDPSGSFDRVKYFIRSNDHICKWIGLSVLSIQGFSLLLAMLLKSLGPTPCYDSDEEYGPMRAPLLKNSVFPHQYVVADPVYRSNHNGWNIRSNEQSGASMRK